MDNNLILIGLVIFSIVLIYLLYLNFIKIKDIGTLKDEISNLKNSIEGQRKLQSSVTNNILSKVGELELRLKVKTINELSVEDSNETGEDEQNDLYHPNNNLNKSEYLMPGDLPVPSELSMDHLNSNDLDDNDLNSNDLDDHDLDDLDDHDLDELDDNELDDNELDDNELDDTELDDNELDDTELDDNEGLDLEQIDDDMVALDKDLDEAIDDLEREIEEDVLNGENLISMTQTNELEEQLKTKLRNELGNVDSVANVSGNIDAFFPEGEANVNNNNLEDDVEDDVEEIITTNKREEENVKDEVIELSEENLKNHDEINGKHNVIESIEQLDSSSVNLDTLDNIEIVEDNDLEDVDMSKVVSRKYLTVLTVKQLKAICKEFDIKTRGNKNELIKVIVQHKKNE